MSVKKVSIIISSYNHAKYIKEAILSVVCQDFTNYELIIIDDQSTDNSVEIIKEISDPRIKLIVNEVNLGMVRTVNKAIEIAKGEYIALFNSDDIFWSKSKLSKQVEFLDSHKEYGAVFTGVQLIDDSSKPFLDFKHNYYSKFNRTSNKNRWDWLAWFFYNSNCLCYPSAMIRKSCYDELGLFNTSYTMMQDLDMWIRICKKYEIFILEEKLTAFRVSESSTSCDKANTPITIFESRKVLEHFLHFSSLEEFQKIFPEIKCDSLEAVPFAIAKTCLNLGSKYRNFAVDFLFRFINKESDLATLSKNGISYSDLIFARKCSIIPKFQKNKNKIGIVCNNDENFASTRYRYLNVRNYFKDKGIKLDIESYNEKNIDQYSVIIFFKAFLDDNLKLANHLVAHGKKIYFDICDNYFYNPRELESYKLLASNLKNILLLSEVITVSTKTLGERIIENIPEAKNKIHVMGDAIDNRTSKAKSLLEFFKVKLKVFQYRKKISSPNVVKLVWFGNKGSESAQWGMSDLLRIRALIEEYGKTTPIVLTIISNDKELYKKLISRWKNVKTIYLKWRLNSFLEFIKLNDAAIIPVTDNDFTSCKTNNRMVTAFSCGLDVIADPTPSYKEFEQYCFLGDWRRGIEEVIKSKKDKSGKKKRIDGARKIIKEAYSLDIIARKWLNLLNKVN